MIKYIRNADIFASRADALINPVNSKGVMGKGLALEFKKRFPEYVPPYKAAVASGKFIPGVLLYVHLEIQPDLFGLKRPGVILFPTKDHWKDPSRLEWIANGLDFLRAHYQAWGLKSAALPQLGCGLGGLNWADVQPLFDEYLGAEPLEAEVYLNIERYEKPVDQE